MSISRKITEGASGGGGGSGGYVDDVFSTYLYEGEGKGANRDIVNGIDLDDKGGLVWLKKRSAEGNHYLFDTERGENLRLYSNLANSEVLGSNTLNSFNDDGFSLGPGDVTTAGDWVSWTFAKQEGFFDVVTISIVNQGGGTQTFSHNLGVKPGMMLIKQTDGAYNWIVYHKAKGYQYRATLNFDYAFVGPSDDYFGAEPTDTEFTLGEEWGWVDREAVVYLFADDAPMFGPDGDESIIRCGSYTGNGSASDGPEIDLGWEPQFLMVKCSSHSRNWILLDSARGIVSGGEDACLIPNEADAEYLADYIKPLSRGFKIASPSGVVNASGNEFIYMAIRRGMKPAEEFDPEELFSTITGDDVNTPGYNHGFVTDMAWRRTPASDSQTNLSSRLNQGNELETNDDLAERANTGAMFDYMEGWWNRSRGTSVQSWGFRRTPGFLDVVTYAGTNSDLTVGHSLGVVPEMMWVKTTNNARNWAAIMPTISLSGFSGVYLQGILDFDNPFYDRSYSSPINCLASPPTDTTFELLGNAIGGNAEVNNSGWDYIAYLFASSPGRCDIGTYTGNGNYLDIDCGFTNGARFVLLKRTDAAGDWMYFDTLRGISDRSSPMLKLNTTAAQDPASFIRPFSGGFQVTSNPTGIASAKYIYMAIA